MRVFRNFIAGAWVDASTGATFVNVNPADTLSSLKKKIEAMTGLPVGNQRILFEG